MDRVYNLMKKMRMNAVILTDGYNIHYLSGYSGHTGMALITMKHKRILTDSRYTEQVTIEAPEFECIDIKSDGYAKTINRLLCEEFFACVEGDKDLSTQSDNNVSSAPKEVENSCKTCANTVCTRNTIRVGFENEDISYKQFKTFLDVLDDRIGLMPIGDKINELRIIKSKEEIEKITMAEHIGDMAFSYVKDLIKPGMTEVEVALLLENYMRSHGVSGLSFDTIAASGRNSSLPHAVPTDKKLEEGDFLTMDFGCIYKGYCSDMTRTVFIGKEPSDKQKQVYEIVLKAQLAALDMIKPGVSCYEVDKCARDIIRDAGYGDYFGHGLGHSVGLFIHEEPRFSPKCKDILESGMVITVEPGIYLPGEFGVRIEDLVVVTEDGYRNLAESPKELICI